MRTIILAVILFIAVAPVAAQLPTNAAGKVEYTEVISVDSFTAEKLYSNAKLFITNAFKSGKDVTQLNDDAGKTIVGKGNMPVTVAMFIGSAIPARVDFSITIQCKQGKYKYSITDFVFVYQQGTLTPSMNDNIEEEKPRRVTKKQWEGIRSQVDTRIQGLVTDLKSKMKASNDW